MNQFYTVDGTMINRPTLKLFGRVWTLAYHFGRLTVHDIGKRITLKTRDLLQIENDQQRDVRLALDRFPWTERADESGQTIYETERFKIFNSAGRWYLKDIPNHTVGSLYPFDSPEQAKRKAENLVDNGGQCGKVEV